MTSFERLGVISALLLRTPMGTVFLIGNLVFFAILVPRMLGGMETLELAAYDLFFRLRPQHAKPDPRIVLIAVSEDDLGRLGWPLSDDILANLLEKLASHRPRVIGLDIFRDIPVLTGHERLNDVLARDERIVAIMKFPDEMGAGAVSPPPALRDSQRVGFVDVFVDQGGVVRRGLLFLDDGHRVEYAFALRMALSYLEFEGIVPQPGIPDPRHIRLGKVTLSPLEANDGGYVGMDARGYQFLLDFQGAPADFSRYSLDDILSDRVPSAALEDKIVIVGYAAKSVKDHFYFPFSRGLEDEQRIFGITLHAHITSQLLRTALQGTTPISVISEVQESAWIWLWAMLGALVGLRVRSLKLFSIFAISGLAVLAGLSYAVWLQRWWIPFVPPTLGWLSSVGLMTSYMANREKVQRTQLMQLFSRYIPQKVAQALWEQRHVFLEGGRPRPQKLTATVFFSDLRGFTSVSERMDPRTLMGWLNTYMETMAALVMKHGGVVDKFIGDAIMAVFGVPFARTSENGIGCDARRAVNCALAMRGALNDLNLRWQAQGLPTIGIRIGIFTGPLVAGSLGSSQRMEYTVIGDTVNVASRLESLKGVDSHDLISDEMCRILIGETTLRYLEQDYHIRYVGEMQLKGKKQAVAVYQVTGYK